MFKVVLIQFSMHLSLIHEGWLLFNPHHKFYLARPLFSHFLYPPHHPGPLHG